MQAVYAKCIDRLLRNMLRLIVMKALLQRVSSAAVEIEGTVVGQIGRGLLVLLCAMKGDSDKDLDHVVKKVSQLRIFADERGKMNLSVMDINGEVLVVSQFTLAAQTRKGNRPSFDEAEGPEKARVLYVQFLQRLEALGVPVRTGAFGTGMAVSLTNDGPVTVLVDSREG
jgi:D-tyrosyl-tRNA(Tyr) deacylase